MALDRRLQILLDEPRYQMLSRRARRQHTSVAAVIREAIDALQAEEQRRMDVIEAVLNGPQIELPADPADLRRELDEMFRDVE